MRGYRFVLFKAYFDKGFSLTNYLKYMIAFFGLASRDIKSTLWIAFFYAIACWIIGFIWIKYGFYDAENEVSNRFNPLAKELRKSMKIKRFK